MGSTDPAHGRPGTRRSRSLLYEAISALLIAAFIMQTVRAAHYASVVQDEPIYVSAGYEYWVTRTLAMNNEHPPLIKLLMTLPLLPMHLAVPTEDISWREYDQERFGRVFLFRDWPRGEPILFRARLAVIALGVMLAVAVRGWAAELWGPEAGLAALFLLVFEPNILAHSSLATLDVGLTLFTFLAFYALWKWRRTRHVGYAAATALFLAGALLSKFSALALLPIFLAACCLERREAGRGGVRLRATAASDAVRLGALAALVLVVFYALMFGWHSLIRPKSVHLTIPRVLAHVPFLARPDRQAWIIHAGQAIQIPGVDVYLGGALAQYRRVSGGLPAPSFLMGQHSVHGWWYYYPVSFLIKTPLPLLLLAGARFALLPWLRPTVDEYFVSLPAIGLLALSLAGRKDFGLRYLLPVYPFLFVWASRVVAVALRGVSTAVSGGTGERYGQKIPAPDGESTQRKNTSNVRPIAQGGSLSEAEHTDPIAPQGGTMTRS